MGGAQPAAADGDAASGRPATIPIEAFAALPELRRPLLSPDGRQIVALNETDGLTSLALIDSDRPEARPHLIRIGKTTITNLRWAGNRRLLLTVRASHKIGGEEIPFLRLLALDVPSGASRVVDTKSRGIYAGDVLYSDPAGSWALVASQDDVYSYPSVKRVDLATGQAQLIEKARENVWDWYADDQGVVRAGIAYQGRRWTIWYRDKADEKLTALRGKFAKADDSTVDRIIFGRDANSWVVTNERTGRFGLYRYDLKSGAVGEALFEHAEVDLDDVSYDPVTGKVEAIEYEDDRRRVLWLDPELKTLQAKLDRALPGTVNFTTDWSQDDKRALVWSYSGSDPGGYYLLDRATARMHPVINPYPEVDPDTLAPVKYVRYQARDGLIIPAYLTLPRGREPKGLPLIIMPHGGPFARDNWEYDPTVQFFANRGYAVLQPQFRGSTGYGKNFVSRGYGEVGRRMQDDLDDGMNWLAKSGQIDPERVCVVGGSYGGYAAMWAATRNPERYRCAASIAGVSDLQSMLRYDRKLFSATRYYREWRNQVGGEGKVDLRAVSPISFAGKVRVPLLIGHGEEDERVRPSKAA
jgi:dipeptidyl aminopeptidase/acylaminoacyl peptidase